MTRLEQAMDKMSDKSHELESVTVNVTLQFIHGRPRPERLTEVCYSWFPQEYFVYAFTPFHWH